MIRTHIPHGRLECHRHALALMPDATDPDPGTAFLLPKSTRENELRHCTCATSKEKTCAHIKALTTAYRTMKKNNVSEPFDTDFKKSLWHTFSSVLADIYPAPLNSMTIRADKDDENPPTHIQDNKNRLLITVHALSLANGRNAHSTRRLLDRLGNVYGMSATTSRYQALKQLYLLTMSDTERALEKMGRQTRRQALEQSLWYRVAYHFFHSFPDPPHIYGHVDRSGDFSLDIVDSSLNSLFTVFLPKPHVGECLSALRNHLANPEEMAVHGTPLKTVIHMRMTKTLHLEMRLSLAFTDETGQTTRYDRESLEPFRFKDKWYLTDKKIFAQAPSPDPLADKFDGKFRHVVPNKKIPALLTRFGDALWDNAILDDSVKQMKVFKAADMVELFTHAMDQDWYHLSVHYGFGDTRVSLAHILNAKAQGKRFISISKGWIDCQAFDTDGFTRIPAMPVVGQLKAGDDAKPFRVNRLDIYRLRAATDLPINVTGDPPLAEAISRVMAMHPSVPYTAPQGLTSTLRAYQEKGVEWLCYLYENHLGGLLCDDMGLGKTHQTMAFLCLLKEKMGVGAPFLVVSPTTVISHWQSKLKMHAPGLTLSIFHGPDRDLESCLRSSEVILTSYGVLRQDMEKLTQCRFGVAVFDEAQYLKNSGAQQYEAAQKIDAHVKFGLTGTPIENHIQDIKSLFDLVLPGYLGSDSAFDFRYVKPIMNQKSLKQKDELQRLIAPFTLRRLKSTVLSELPPKIEDIRLCQLSAEQVKLYQDAVATKGKDLIRILQSGDEPVPYMHIFALLNLLKQICNHPAVLDDPPNDFHAHDSGKWDAFTEILTQCLENNQKVVVYSQYLAMIQIIRRHLDECNVPTVTLTGTTKNRGAVIDRFNTDPGCRVLVGSLKAGGAGIDLVAASAVIHYDRWWNAAREDQATDRVHRIGQTRGVQVFKLVCQGTLEEKISAIIEAKRHLMDHVVQEDDPHLLKTFSRDQLLALLN